LISGRFQRRHRALAWSTLASAAVHVIVLTLLFWAVAHVFIPRGAKETVTATTSVVIQHPAVRSAPTPVPARAVRRVAQHESAPARTPRRELAKEVAVRAPALPPPRPSIVSPIQRDEAGYAREVAQLNKQNDVHAIPTIDPGSQESLTKSYQFAVPSQLRGEEHGNGIITPTRRWQDNGRDCYYGHYEFTYPDGAMETGDIVWPFCFDSDSDPFKEAPHEIPFPLPLDGFKLPPGTQLPPIEKTVYEHWAAENAGSTP
jgi:hypothetical protein